jgi:hypothetical protein
LLRTVLNVTEFECRRLERGATSMARVWLGEFFELNCQVMPNPSGCKQLWHLPANMLRKDVYELYLTWCNAAGYKPVSMSTISTLWKEDYSHAKIPQKGRFKSCTV